MNHNVRKRTFSILCWGLTTRQPLWVILCRLPEKGRKEIEEIVEEMKERNRDVFYNNGIFCVRIKSASIRLIL